MMSPYNCRALYTDMGNTPNQTICHAKSLSDRTRRKQGESRKNIEKHGKIGETQKNAGKQGESGENIEKHEETRET